MKNEKLRELYDAMNTTRDVLNDQYAKLRDTADGMQGDPNYYEINRSVLEVEEAIHRMDTAVETLDALMED
jgi:hypothetical protein